MTVVTVDFNRKIGKIKNMNSVGQPPIEGISTGYFHFLTEANMHYSRLHDVGGPFGRNMFVDIPNIFRDFDADVDNEENYDFAFTDILIKGLIDAKVEPIFRLGVTIENYAAIKSYRIAPPKDFNKWARICEHIIMHYNEGWANGFEYNITYWEIWNEPENEPYPEKNPMWTGSMEEFFELYDVASKHLKKCFGDKIKVGGYGSCGLWALFHDPKSYGLDIVVDIKPSRPEQDIYCMKFFHEFLKYIREHSAPLDFFSWHSYSPVSLVECMAEYISKQLEESGFGDSEIMLNEWNPITQYGKLGSSEASATAAAVMCALQNKKVDILCYYDARMQASLYGGLFNAYTEQPFCTYYPFYVFGEMLRLGTQVACEFKKEEGFYALAASDGKENIVMFSNITDKDNVITTNLNDMDVYIIDKEHMYEKTDWNSTEFVIKANQVAVLKNR